MNKMTMMTQEVRTIDGRLVAQITTYLEGDGSTPIVQTMGTGSIKGYADDGTVIIDDDIDELIKEKQKEFMAEAIKEQKNLCVENGVDPSLVNYFGAEKESVENNG